MISNPATLTDPTDSDRLPTERVPIGAPALHDKSLVPIDTGTMLGDHESWGGSMRRLTGVAPFVAAAVVTAALGPTATSAEDHSTSADRADILEHRGDAVSERCDRATAEQRRGFVNAAGQP